MGTRHDPAVPKTPAVLRALRVPAPLDAEIEKERRKTQESRTAAMVRRLERNGQGAVDWKEFDRQVQVALRRTPQVHRALKAAREAMGL